MQYCSLQHQTLLPSPVTSTTGCYFCFGSISSFLLEVFLHSSSVAYWAPTDLGSSSFSVLSFCFFILFMGFSRQEYWSDLPFPSPMDHILSEADILRRGSKNPQKNYTKDFHNPDNRDAVITNLELDILEYEVKWALGSITSNKASGGNGIPVELFQILKDDAMKVLHSICQQIWKTQQWP